MTNEAIRFMARKLAAMRKTHGGGRPKNLKPCPVCKRKFGVNEMRKHKPKCKPVQSASSGL